MTNNLILNKVIVFAYFSQLDFRFDYAVYRKSIMNRNFQQIYGYNSFWVVTMIAYFSNF